MISPESFFIWLFVTLALYLISCLFTRFTSFRFPNHRKLWNIFLLFAFAITACLGIILALFDAFDTALMLSVILAHIHVRTGIVVFIISIFHFFWYLNYFKKAIKQLREGDLWNGFSQRR